MKLNKPESFTDEQRKAIINSLDCKMFSKDEIISKADYYESLISVQSGKIELSDKENKKMNTIEKGETYGDTFSSKEENVNVRGFTMRATQPTFVITLGKKKLIEIFGEKVLTLPLMNIHKEAITKNKLLLKLTEIQIEKLSAIVTFKKFNKGETLVKKGEVPLNLLTIIDGEIKDDNTEKTFHKHHIFIDGIEFPNQPFILH